MNKIIQIKTATSSGKPNVNNVIYSKEVLQNCILKSQEKISNRLIKLTNGSVYNRDHHEFRSVDLKDVLGDVIEINDGAIKVAPFDENALQQINTLIKNGYVAGMRYLGELNNNTVEKIYEIVAFDMLKINNEVV